MSQPNYDRFLTQVINDIQRRKKSWETLAKQFATDEYKGQAIGKASAYNDVLEAINIFALVNNIQLPTHEQN